MIQTSLPDLDRVTQTLLAHPAVEDGVVLKRQRPEGSQELIAYVVLAAEVVAERLKDEVRAVLQVGGGTGHCVPLSHLPLTVDGRIDYDALAAIPVIDADLGHRWEQRWRTMPGVDQVAVVIEERSEVEPSVRVDPADSVAGNGSSDRRGPLLVTRTKSAGGTRRPPKAISHGHPIHDDPGMPVRLSDVLARAARQHPTHGLLYIGTDGSQVSQTYPELLDESQRLLTRLRAVGLRPADPVILQFEHRRSFITAFWACVLGGFVPIPVAPSPSYREPNATLTKLLNAWQMLDHPLVLAEAALAADVRSLTGRPGMEQFRMETIEGIEHYAADRVAHVGQPGDLALMLLTSGSTGMPKGVMQSQRSLLDRCAGTVQLNGFTSHDVSLNWFPLDHVGGLVMFHLRDVYCGNAQIQAPIELVLKDPLRWLDWIARYRATVTWAPNFAFSMMNDHAEEIDRRRWDLSSMRFILNGGEAIVARTARRFLELLAPHGLPATAMRPAWGMSETCSAATYSDRFTADSTSDSDAFVCVGAPIPGLSVRIVDGRDEVVEEGAIGRLQVKGRSVTSGYYRNPAVTEAAFSADGWFTTGDLGYLDDGRLTITGRENDVIIVNGANYYSHEIEAATEEVSGVDVSYVAACAVRDRDSATDRIAIFFSATTPPDRGAELARQIRAAVLHKAGVSPHYVIPVGREEIPKTSIGKIQRAELRQRFERGEFVAASHAMRDPSIPAPVYRRRWRRRKAEVAAAAGRGGAVIFLDDTGLGTGLCAELESMGLPAIRVEAAPGFSRLGPAHYRLQPACPEHYDRLLAALATENIDIEHVVHLWSYHPAQPVCSGAEQLEHALDPRALSVLFLVQALARYRTGPQRLLVVSSQSQDVRPDEPVVAARGVLLGVLRTAAQEFPWLKARHLDLPLGLPPGAALCIVHELQTVTPDREVAYRDGCRYVPRLERVPRVANASSPSPFKQRGMYLVSGGLGGVSVEIARHLLTRYDARLLLLGRTALPERNAGPVREAAADTVAERMARFHALQGLGGELRYEAVDVCDLAGLRAAVTRACAAWGCELDGVIHQAGLFAERPLAEEDPTSLAAILRPKVAGTWALHQLVVERPEAVFIASSSLNGLWGGFGVGAYAAANAFLDCFTQHQRATYSLRSYSIAWSPWGDVGMNRGSTKKEAARRRGYRTLTVHEALESLETALAQPPGHVLVGLDDGNRYIRRHLESGPVGLQGLQAYFTRRGAGITDELAAAVTMPDIFGTPTRCPGILLDRWPLTVGGELDRQAFRQLEKPAEMASPPGAEPPTRLEQVIASIWRDVLGVTAVGINDNFFELGGDSLRLAQLSQRLGDVLGVDVRLTDLFQYPTISAVAAHLATAENDNHSLERDRRGMRGDARRQRVRLSRRERTDGDCRPGESWS